MHLSNLSDGSTLQCMPYIPLILPFFSASGEAPEERNLKEEGKRPTPPPRDSDDEGRRRRSPPSRDERRRWF